MKVLICFALAKYFFWGLMHFLFALNKIFDQRKLSFFFYRQDTIAKQRPNLSLQK